MKYSLKLIISVIVFILCLGASLSYSMSSTDKLEKKGVVIAANNNFHVNGKIKLIGYSNKEKIKLIIKFENKKRWYDLKDKQGEFKKEVWLIDGKGLYTVYVMINEYDNVYSYGPKFTVNNLVDSDRFIVPTKHVESHNQKIIELSKKINKNEKKQIEKAKNIYNWIKNNIQYDSIKYRNQKIGNFNDKYGALNTFVSKKGVCYDFATLYAALARASNLKTKVIKGNYITKSIKELHAWNEVYIEEEKRWVNIDSTFAYTYNKNYFDNDDFNKEHVKILEY